MWVVFRKSDSKEKEVIGVTADSPLELEKEEAIREVAAGLVAAGDPADYDAFLVKDRARILEIIAGLGENRVLVRPRGRGQQVEVVGGEPSFLLLTAEADQRHPVDGLAMIPADGESFAAVTIRKVDQRRKPRQGRKDADQLWLRTDRGSLRDRSGKNEIRQLKLVRGQGAFRLCSEPTRCVATVRVFNEDRNLEDAEIRVEFV